MNAELRSVSFKGWCRSSLQAAAIPASAALGGNLLRGSSHSHQLIQLSRLTIAFEEPAAAAQLLSAPADAIAASHDILAVQPLSERALQQVCSSLDVDIITFDLSKRLPFRLKPATLQEAVKRGAHLEICYAVAIRDEGARRTCFANALALSRAMGGKGIIVSSGARSVWEMRAPHDVINLATLFGLNQQQAKDAVSERCAAVIKHAEKRRAYKSSVRLITQPADPEEDWPSLKTTAPPASVHAPIRDFSPMAKRRKR
ncbi:hypothetical protein CVIRNUC_008583 [Coccomyxa viridis]|uniref:Uncharacterized protein n=1 Tax=Coccomyxa viridis TaxID=1274662 RepID=A0AAV1IH79_9CHLO|nr:hypothetical protein CVIRNUC_008583 [Coccomyxa viridis]